MGYGPLRFLYQNLLTQGSMLSVGSAKPGVVSGAKKVGTGSATLNISAPQYTGGEIRVYQVEIDNVALGNEIGQAKYRWRRIPYGWSATQVPTHSTLQALEDGISISWTAGAGNDFNNTDYWTFLALDPFGKGNLIDGDPNTAYRSNGLSSVWIKADLGSAQTVKAVVLYGHNLTSSATVTLSANSVDSWTSPPFTLPLTWNDTVILGYLNQTYRYFRLDFSDAANPDGYISVAEWYLGGYVELSRNPTFGLERTLHPVLLQSTSAAGISRAWVQSRQRTFRLSYPMLTDADIAQVQALLQAVNDTKTGKAAPFFINLWSDTPQETYLVQMREDWTERLVFHDVHETELTLEEVVRSRV